MFRRALALLVAILLGSTVLSACSNNNNKDGKESSSDSGLSGVDVTGKAGEEPTVKITKKLSIKKTETKVDIEGDGEEVAKGDSILSQIWIGNGTTKKETLNTWQQNQAQLLTLGSVPKSFDEGLVGQKVGSRVTIVSPPADAFGDQGNPNLGLAATDTAVFVIDILEKVPAIDGEAKTPAAWAPKLIEKDGLVTGLDFAGTPKPGNKLQITELIAGNGPEVKSGQLIVVDYLGQVYKAKKPFDDSFSRGAPMAQQIGVGALVKGWDQALVGQKVGSRLIIAVPPKLGYGPKGNEQAGIKGTDTMYFLIDLRSAK